MKALPTEGKPTQPEPQRLAKAEVPAVKEPAAGADQPAKAAETTALSALKAEIARAVPSLPNSAPAPHLEVRRTGEGVLISITDEINFSMFGIGSAEPTPKVVKALERIAKILNSRPGRIVVTKRIAIPRPRTLATTFEPYFVDIVHELREHISQEHAP